MGEDNSDSSNDDEGPIPKFSVAIRDESTTSTGDITSTLVGITTIATAGTLV